MEPHETLIFLCASTPSVVSPPGAKDLRLALFIDIKELVQMAFALKEERHSLSLLHRLRDEIGWGNGLMVGLR